jgi:hypothetical protein
MIISKRGRVVDVGKAASLHSEEVDKTPDFSVFTPMGPTSVLGEGVNVANITERVDTCCTQLLEHRSTLRRPVRDLVVRTQISN